MMNNDDKVLQALEGINTNLVKINTNMLKVFWIVAVFALLYFGLMVYLLFVRQTVALARAERFNKV